MVQEYLARLSAELTALDLPSAGDRSLWSALPGPTREVLIRRGEEYLGCPWPTLTCGDYLAFSRTGQRTGFEEKYFARRRAVCALALAECAEGKGRFLEELCGAVWAICEESGWQLPPHNNFIRDTPPLPLPDPDRPVPDLFACETAASLALLQRLLGEQLDALAPGIGARIGREIGLRVLRPYLNAHFWWMGNGDEPMCNWTSWCTQNVLLAVFSGDYPQSTRRAVVEKAAYSLDCFLKDYGEDGCCEEGALYYRHAGLTLWGALEILDRVSGGVFAPLFQTEKVRNIAAYILNVHVGDGFYLNYADCMPKPGPCGAREYLFARRTGSAALEALACREFAARQERDLPQDSALGSRLLDALLSPRLLLPHPHIDPPPQVFYPSTGLWIARDGPWCAAVRAGHNGMSHGHCDAGSLIVYKNARPLLIDIGVESYSAKTFSDERCSLWTIRSDYHNLPTVGGCVQQSGPGACPTAVALSHDGGERITMDLSGAYPPQAGAFSYRRTVTLRSRRLTVEDCYDGDREAVLSLLLCEKPLWRDSTLTTSAGSIRLSPSSEPEIQALPISDPRLRLCWPDTLYRVLVPVKGQVYLEFE